MRRRGSKKKEKVVMATSQWVPKDTNVREVKLAKLGEGESGGQVLPSCSKHCWKRHCPVGEESKVPRKMLADHFWLLFRR